MSWLRRKIQRAKTGKGNWFGDGSDGDICVGTAGAEQSFDGGVTWTPVPGWTLVGAVVSIPSVQDGDMVVVNAINLTIDEGYTLTVANRCRGLLVYCTGNAVINGTLSMTARGCHANPADATVTSDTPVAPSDGNAVPPDGLIIRRLAAGHTDTHTTATLGYGCGQAVVESEANQPEVDGNGVVIAIPRVGGLGGEAVGGAASSRNGLAGYTAENAPGGGGSGGFYSQGNNDWAGAGAAATCFSGGPGGGGNYNGTDNAASGSDFGGKGGDSEAIGTTGGGGAGNPPGESVGGYASDGNPGTGGLILLFVRGSISGSGAIEAKGSDGGLGIGVSERACGGSSGGGLIGTWYAGENNFTGTHDVSGGAAIGLTGIGGAGGDGDILGPTKIDA